MAVSRNSIDIYLEALPDDVRMVLAKLRQTIKSTAPDAEELISYKMPAYKFHGMLIYFAAFKDHCSLFPGSKAVINKFREELKEYSLGPGTIQFTVEKPLPATLVKKIVKERMQENTTRYLHKTAIRKKEINNKNFRSLSQHDYNLHR